MKKQKIHNVEMLNTRKWQTLDSRVVYQADPWVRLSLDTVKTDRGKIVEDFHQLQLPDFTVVVAETIDGQILCLRQYKHGLGGVSVTFPGGMVDPDESPHDAVKRELLEETGFVAPHWQYLGGYVVHGNLGAGHGHFYHAVGAYNVQEADSGDLESMSIEFKTWEAIRRCMMSGEIQLMNHITALSLVMTNSFLSSTYRNSSHC